jgi:hypothetical protein
MAHAAISVRLVKFDCVHEVRPVDVSRPMRQPHFPGITGRCIRTNAMAAVIAALER